jgi:hypothetical protein
MSDLKYFQRLLTEAKDPMMIAFYQTAVCERNGGHLGNCQHVMTHHHLERSYGATYYWTECLDCGTNFDHTSQQPW